MTTLRPFLRCSMLFGLVAMAPAQSLANLDWQVDACPPSRSNIAMAFHEGMGATVLFGGNVEQIPIGDTWTFDGVWRRVNTAASPSPRYQHRMAYDSLRQRVVLFGGLNATTMLGETWAFDSSGWTQLAPANSPPPTRAHNIAYDAVRDRVVMTGGRLTLSGQVSNTMWEFDGSTWTASVAGSVPAAFGDMVFDTARGQLLSLNPTGLRAWDGTAWTVVDNSGLPAGTIGQMLYDAGTQRVLLVNPENVSGRQASVYARAGAGWTVVATPTPLPGAQVFSFDTARQRVVAFDDASTFTSVRSNTWELQASTWQPVVLGIPRGRRFPGLAYDTARRRTVLHGGANSSSSLFDTWELDDRTWLLDALNLSGSLSRVGHTFVFDESRGVVVLFGGESLFANYVLEWHGTGQWTSAAPALAPTGRRYHAATYDSLRARMMVFGGETASPALADLWAWNGQAWTNLTPAITPPARRLAGLSYDRHRDRLVLFGGTNGTATFGDTWEYDGLVWQPVEVVPSPPPRSAHVQVYDSFLQRTIVHGGTAAGSDTWAWDGTAWTQLVTTNSPPGGPGSGAVYDPDRREVVLFGGDPARGEVWRLRDATLGEWASSHQGCETGAGSLTVVAADALAIGASCVIELRNMPATFFALPIVWGGFSDQEWEGVPLPFPLGVLGSPDCWLRTQPLVPLYAVATVPGVAKATLGLPDEPALVGLLVYLQGFVWDFGQPRITTSNLLQSRVGVR